MAAIKLRRALIVAVLLGVLLATPHARVGAGGEPVSHVASAPGAPVGLGDALIRCRDLDRQAAIDGGCPDLWDRNFQRLLGQEVPETAAVPRNVAAVPSGGAR
jgi:conjugative transfer region protein TrbK